MSDQKNPEESKAKKAIPISELLKSPKPSVPKAFASVPNVSAPKVSGSSLAVNAVKPPLGQSPTLNLSVSSKDSSTTESSTLPKPTVNIGRLRASMPIVEKKNETIASSLPQKSSVPKDMDFEAFRRKREREKQVSNIKPGILSRERYQTQKGITGGGAKYQDQNLGRYTQKSKPQKVDENRIKKLRDHRLGNGVGLPYSHPSAGHGEHLHDHRLGNGIDPEISAHALKEDKTKYQDHKLGHGLGQDILDISAGQGSQYHDHRLGKGFPTVEYAEGKNGQFET